MTTKRKKKKKPSGPNKNLKQVMDPILAKALSNPLRGHILATLGDRIASPKEMADEIDVDVKELNYHIKVLARIGLIKLMRIEKRRGAREHFYTLSSRVVYFDDRQWRRMPEPIRSSFSASLLKTVMDEAAEALQAGTFNARNNHHSRTAMVLDEDGSREVLELMDETLERMLQIRKRCSGRLKSSGAGIPMEVFMIGFETAAGAKQRARRPDRGRLTASRSTPRRGQRRRRTSTR